MGCAQPRRIISPQNQIPIERIHYDRVPPMLVAPSPPYVKSALKKPQFNGGRANPSPLFRGDAKSVNFYQTVQVRCRTPTPNKVWYEKSSTTMPMRKHPPNDDDDDDYEPADDGDENDDDDDDWTRKPSAMPRLGTPIPLRYSNENESSSSPPVNRIKVRQRLPPSDSSLVPSVSRPSFLLSTDGRLVQNVT